MDLLRHTAWADEGRKGRSQEAHLAGSQGLENPQTSSFKHNDHDSW